MTKVISLYNHKGGVSKTTTTFNLAHKLADRGHSVLVIDADPQCNMTELLLAPLISQLDADEEITGVEQSLPGTTILEALRPRIAGTTAHVDLSTVETVLIREGLSLLRGDVGLSDIEDALSEAHSQRFSDKIHEKRTYVALGDFFRRLAAEEKYDILLIDVGPSSGAITRACFLACDAFFVPTVPDRFNVQAIGTLSSIFGRWLREHGQIVEDFQSLGLPVSLGRPVFLGMIVQNFKTLGGEPKKGYRFWIDRLPGQYQDRLLPVLKKYSLADRDLSSGLDAQDCIVSRIPDFVSLAPLMQELGKPVFSITQAETRVIGPQWQGNVWSGKLAKMDEFGAQFDKLSEIVEAL